MKNEMYGSDLEWIQNEKLVGIKPHKTDSLPDFGLYNQRGYHWPTPVAYTNQGKERMKDLSVLIKPFSNGCNMKCEYCFTMMFQTEERLIIMD